MNKRLLGLLMGVLGFLVSCHSLTQKLLEDFLNAHSMQKVAVQAEDGTTFHYLTNYQSGDTRSHVVLLHGFGSTKEFYLPLVPSLEEDYVLWIPDLPGSGDNERDLQQNFSLVSQAEYVKRFVDFVDSSSFSLVGISMGAGVATAYTLRWPDSVESLALLSPLGERSPRLSPFYKQLLRTGLLRSDILAFSAKDLQRLYLLLAHKPLFLPYIVHRGLVEHLIPSYDFYYKVALDIFTHSALYPLSNLSGQLRGPVLFLWGEHDKIFDVSTIQNLRKQLPEARYEVIPDVGHILETPSGGFDARVAVILKDFLPA